jgi:hypothetical protein
VKIASKSKVNRLTKSAPVRNKNRRIQSRAIVKPEIFSLAERVEKVLITGDLSPLTPEERVSYYKAVCKSLGLNPLTRPFDYILFRESEGGPGRLQLYARKDCAEQLRKKYGVAVISLKREIVDGTCIAEALVKDANGRTDAATGVVSLSKYKDGKYLELKGKERDNAIMKAETKAKRRATLSICGLGFLDESEIETVENYSMVTSGGRIIEEQSGSKEASQAVAERQIEEHLAKNPPPENAALFYTWFEESKTAQITGDKQLMTAQRDLLRKHWNATVQAVVVDGETLENLKFQFEQRGVPFKQLKAAK